MANWKRYRWALPLLVAALLSGGGSVQSEELPVSQLPDFALLKHLGKDPQNKQVWDALFDVRRGFDGAAHEEYAYRVHLFFAEHPEVLHFWFLRGDARAAILLQDAFAPGTWVLHDAEGGDDSETERILSRLREAVSELADLRPPRSDYDALSLHEMFVGRAQQLLAEWPEKRAALLRGQ